MKCVKMDKIERIKELEKENAQLKLLLNECIGVLNGGVNRTGDLMSVVEDIGDKLNECKFDKMRDDM